MSRIRKHSLETTEKCSCGGCIKISGSSRFVRTGPVVFGGKTPGYNMEDFSASCNDCGLSYNPHHNRFSRYLNEIKKEITS